MITLLSRYRVITSQCGWTLLLALLLTSGCQKMRDCRYVGTGVAFTGFDSTELDTVDLIITEKGNFNNVIETR